MWIFPHFLAITATFNNRQFFHIDRPRQRGVRKRLHTVQHVDLWAVLPSAAKWQTDRLRDRHIPYSVIGYNKQNYAMHAVIRCGQTISTMNINEPYSAAADGSLGFKPRLKTRIWVGSISHHFRELRWPNDVMILRVRRQWPCWCNLELWPAWPWRFMAAGRRRGVATRALFERGNPVADAWSAMFASSASWAVCGSTFRYVFFHVVIRRSTRGRKLPT